MDGEHLCKGPEIIVHLAELWYVCAVQRNLVLWIDCDTTRIYIQMERLHCMRTARAAGCVCVGIGDNVE